MTRLQSSSSGPDEQLRRARAAATLSCSKLRLAGPDGLELPSVGAAHGGRMGSPARPPVSQPAREQPECAVQVGPRSQAAPRQSQPSSRDARRTRQPARGRPEAPQQQVSARERARGWCEWAAARSVCHRPRARVPRDQPQHRPCHLWLAQPYGRTDSHARLRRAPPERQLDARDGRAAFRGGGPAALVLLLPCRHAAAVLVHVQPERGHHTHGRVHALLHAGHVHTAHAVCTLCVRTAHAVCALRLR